jgi:hypothetical protein
MEGRGNRLANPQKNPEPPPAASRHVPWMTMKTGEYGVNVDLGRRKNGRHGNPALSRTHSFGGSFSRLRRGR